MIENFREHLSAFEWKDAETIRKMQLFVSEQVGLEQHGDEETVKRLQAVKIYKVPWNVYIELKHAQFPNEEYRIYRIPDESLSPEAFYLPENNSIYVKQRSSENITRASCVMGLVAAARSVSKCQEAATIHETCLESVFQAYIANKWVEQSRVSHESRQVPLVLNQSGVPVQIGVFTDKHISEDARQIPVYLPLLEVFDQILAGNTQLFALLQQSRFSLEGGDSLESESQLLQHIDPQKLGIWMQRFVDDFDDDTLIDVYHKAKLIRQTLGLNPDRYPYSPEDQVLNRIFGIHAERTHNEERYQADHPLFSPELDFGDLNQARSELGSHYRSCAPDIRRWLISYPTKRFGWYVREYGKITLAATPPELSRILVQKPPRRNHSSFDQLEDTTPDDTEYGFRMASVIGEIYCAATSQPRRDRNGNNPSATFVKQYLEQRGTSPRENILTLIELLCQDEIPIDNPRHAISVIFFLRAVAGSMDANEDQSQANWNEYQEVLNECEQILRNTGPYRSKITEDPVYYNHFVDYSRLISLLNRSDYSLEPGRAEIFSKATKYLEISYLQEKLNQSFRFYQQGQLGRIDYDRKNLDAQKVKDLRDELSIMSTSLSISREIGAGVTQLLTLLYQEISDELLLAAKQDIREAPKKIAAEVIRRHELEIQSHCELVESLLLTEQ